MLAGSRNLPFHILSDELGGLLLKVSYSEKRGPVQVVYERQELAMVLIDTQIRSQQKDDIVDWDIKPQSKQTKVFCQGKFGHYA